MIRLVLLLLFISGGSFLFLANSKKSPEHASELKKDSIASISKKEVTLTAINDPYWTGLVDQYSTFIQSAIDRGIAPGVAVAIVKDSSIIFLKGFGVRNADTKDSVDTQTVFRLGSVSKCFASILSGVLVQEKTLGWDDQVIRYVPDFQLKSKAQTEAIHLRHVLSHTTGLPYHAFTNQVEEGTALDTMIRNLRGLDLLGKPGDLYSYQNVAYSVIGKVIQSATGKTYEAMMQEKVFAPLHMSHASMNYETMFTNKNSASPHRFTGKYWKTFPLSPTYYNVGPAGGVNASISDMALFLTSLTRNKNSLLDSATQSQIFEPSVRAVAKNRNFWSWKRPMASYYGLGWRVIKFKDDVLNYHGGYVNGFRSEIAIHRKDRIAICVLVNSTGALADQAIPEFFKEYDRFRMSMTLQSDIKTKTGQLHN
jgi:beta-lactamase class C